MQAEQAEKKRKREEDKVAKATARKAAKLRHAAEEAEAKRLAEEQRAATAHTAQENAAKLAAIRAGMQGAHAMSTAICLACMHRPVAGFPYSINDSTCTFGNKEKAVCGDSHQVS